MRRLSGILDNAFPVIDKSNADLMNPAIGVHGRRYYQDQTNVEYLAEFLLVFISPKGTEEEQAHAFEFALGNEPYYWPKDRLALKLFSFYPSSKLETRHPVHQKAYKRALDELSRSIDSPEREKDEIVRLLQSLLSGFVGVARNRTWATQCFLPASSSLIGRELIWAHTAASRDLGVNDWNSISQYFKKDQHAFMARGGELLFLQIAHLFTKEDSELEACFPDSFYRHLGDVNLQGLQLDVESGLKSLMEGALGRLNILAEFIDSSLNEFNLSTYAEKASLGWVPTSTVPEAYLFANEIKNLVHSDLDDLEKLDLLQTLCCMHVLRTMCFQAQRLDTNADQTEGFIGNYVWFVANPSAAPSSSQRKFAEQSFIRIEDLLYRALRTYDEYRQPPQPTNFRDADKHGVKIARKIGKEMGLVVPPKGAGQRFVLSPRMLRLLVIVLLQPGERVRVTEFYNRVFAHFGIPLGDAQVGIAVSWISRDVGANEYVAVADVDWIEEFLKQGGVLVELSDAVSLVHNPSAKGEAS